MLADSLLDADSVLALIEVDWDASVLASADSSDATDALWLALLAFSLSFRLFDALAITLSDALADSDDAFSPA